jgi:hypothetical protein
MGRWVKGSVDSSNWGETLGKGDVFQLGREALDLVVDRRHADPGERSVHGASRRLVDPVVSERSGVGGLGAVLALGDLGAVAVLLHQLLLGEQVVGEDRIEAPDPVQEFELFE